MTKQEIQEMLVSCAEGLGRAPSYFELVKSKKVTRRQIRKHFGSYGGLLRECNLERELTSGQKVPLEKLFADWAVLVRKLKKAPSMSEYEAFSKYSCKPLVRCFGSWRQVAFGLKQFAEGSGLADEWRAELELAAASGQDADRQWMVLKDAGAEARREAPARRPKTEMSGPPYGPPMCTGPLAHAPVNELGVVFLFGAMAQQLGFVVHRLQMEFPDCDAIRKVNDDRWEKVRIEFEYESRNFLRHMHEVSECDLIVCWRHNWPECPLEVVELREAFSTQ